VPAALGPFQLLAQAQGEGAAGGAPDPNAEVHVLDAGHFALDTKADEIAAVLLLIKKTARLRAGLTVVWTTVVILTHILVLGYGWLLVDALVMAVLAIGYLLLTRGQPFASYKTSLDKSDFEGEVKLFAALNHTKVSWIPSSNCFCTPAAGLIQKVQ